MSPCWPQRAERGCQRPPCARRGRLQQPRACCAPYAVDPSVPLPQVIAIAVPEVLGALVSASTAKNLTWYQTLAKPSWAPPTWLFGQVQPVPMAPAGLLARPGRTACGLPDAVVHACKSVVFVHACPSALFCVARLEGYCCVSKSALTYHLRQSARRARSCGRSCMRSSARRPS